VVSGVGVAVYIFLETGSAAWLGVLTAMAAAPFVLVGPFLAIVDRFPRKSVMIAADTIAATGWLAVLALAMSGRLEAWHLVVAAFVGGVGTAFQFPASQAAIPQLVPPGALDRANGLSQLGPTMGVVLGPILATPLVAHWGLEAVIAVDLVTFVAAMATVATVRFDDVPIDDTDRAAGWKPVLDFLRDEGRPLVGLMLTLGVVNLCLAFFNVSLITAATEIGGAARAGLPLAVAGGAMVAGSLAVGAFGIPERRIRTLAITLWMVAVGCAVAASRPSLVLVTVGAGIALVTVPAVNASISTVFHERTPSLLQGRVFGIRGAVGRALEPIGSLVAGLVIARVAVPAVQPGTASADVLAHLIGTGPGRGSAIVLLATGLVIASLATWLTRGSLAATIDAAPVDRGVLPAADPLMEPLAAA
jgi:MFS family permease